MNRPLRSALLFTTLAATSACASSTPSLSNTELVLQVLEQGIGDKDLELIETHVAEDYIQHSAAAADGRQGLLDFLEQGPALGVEVHRVLEDGDKVAAHVSYTFPDGTTLVAFDVFRVENAQLVEHWDALQPAVDASATVSGRSMVDGPTEVTDEALTELNRALVTEFVEVVLTRGEFERVGDFVSAETYLQHNPGAGDGLEGLETFVASLSDQGLAFGYTRTPLVVASGNFVLTGSEGFFGPSGSEPFAVFYDLFRVEEGKIVEHWDVIPTPAPDPNQLPHDNGLF